ncbi:MAG: hypothetical protein H7338_00475, partial [Candidatus Sericytochromatia bacterium]|nr:hypothetical protein [Candidatus Sericytochromatia bacterium]
MTERFDPRKDPAPEPERQSGQMLPRSKGESWMKSRAVTPPVTPPRASNVAATPSQGGG